MRPPFLVLCLLVTLAPPSRAAAPALLLRVGLEKCFSQAATVLLSSDSAFTLQDALTGRPLLRGTPGIAYKVGAGPDGLRVTRDEAGGDAGGLSPDGPVTVAADHDGLVKIAREDDGPQIGGRQALWHHYRGTLTVNCLGDSALGVVNTVPLEAYLYGVVPAEIGTQAPLEAMKAQAVAARTYALKNRGKFAAQGFDLDDTTRSEGYDGWDGETVNTIAAVDATRGLVLTYHGALIDAPYSTDCGGMTACAPDCPYLQAVLDAPQKGAPDYAADAKYHVWTLTYTPAQLLAALSRDPRALVNTLTAFTLDGFDASGRITTATVTGTDATADRVTRSVTGAQLRQILGYDVLRSTRVTLTMLPGGDYFFSGRGWGHGLGMSQEGAMAMASPPYNQGYRTILSHYYVGTTLAPLTPPDAPQVGGRGAYPSSARRLTASRIFCVLSRISRATRDFRSGPIRGMSSS